VRKEVLIEEFELLRRDLAIAAPPDRILGELVADGMLVLRRATGVDAGLRAERPALDDGSFAVRDRVLVELRRFEIPVDRSELLKFVVTMLRFFDTLFHRNKPASIGSPPQTLPFSGEGSRAPVSLFKYILKGLRCKKVVINFDK
jgi:hypothetical protein